MVKAFFLLTPLVDARHLWLPLEPIMMFPFSPFLLQSLLVALVRHVRSYDIELGGGA